MTTEMGGRKLNELKKKTRRTSKQIKQSKNNSKA
jgi:hypothetical protein